MPPKAGSPWLQEGVSGWQGLRPDLVLEPRGPPGAARARPASLGIDVTSSIFFISPRFELCILVKGILWVGVLWRGRCVPRVCARAAPRAAIAQSAGARAHSPQSGHSGGAGGVDLVALSLVVKWLVHQFNRQRSEYHRTHTHTVRRAWILGRARLLYILPGTLGKPSASQPQRAVHGAPLVSVGSSSLALDGEHAGPHTCVPTKQARTTRGLSSPPRQAPRGHGWWGSTPDLPSDAQLPQR